MFWLARKSLWTIAAFTMGILVNSYGERVYREAMRPLADPSPIAQQLMASIRNDDEWQVVNDRLVHGRMHLAISEGIRSAKVMDCSKDEERPVVAFVTDDLRQINRQFPALRRVVEERMLESRQKAVKATLDAGASEPKKATETVKNGDSNTKRDTDAAVNGTQVSSVQHELNRLAEARKQVEELRTKYEAREHVATLPGYIWDTYDKVYKPVNPNDKAAVAAATAATKAAEAARKFSDELAKQGGVVQKAASDGAVPAQEVQSPPVMPPAK